MTKINVLDSSVFNLIAAGEVVERPASIVKELVENSIDANAKNIKIEIENGGLKKIKITDNGQGINKEYVKTAFLPHATSKICNADDLESITTLGFRGEALASIASVTIVNIKTKTAESEVGTELNIKGGAFLDLNECVSNTGTAICIENIFFNTPARIKFLKKPKTEESYITDAIIKQIFANPYVSFEYVIEGKTVFKTKGEGLNEAVEAVYNREITSNLFKTENTLGNFRVSGLISKPTYSRPNRGYQIIMVNGRCVENKIITSAIEKAYADYTLKRMYPMFVLNITVPYDFVDVNVHPSKTDVRFQDNGAVYGFLFKSLYQAVSSYNEVKSGGDSIEYLDDSDKKHDIIDTPIYNKDNIYNNSEENAKPANSNETAYKLSSIFNRAEKNTSSLRSDSSVSYEVMKKLAADELEKKVEESGQNKLFSDEVNVIGQLFNTYIIVEKEDEVYFIDQHAVHEKMIYDKLTAKTGKLTEQTMLVPYIVNISRHEEDFFNNCLPLLNEIGFEVEAFGNLSYKVSAVPFELSGLNLKKFFDEVLNDLSGNNQLKSLNILKERLTQVACKAAIKGGDKLSPQQIDSLIKQIDNSEKIPLQCPHGRPAIIKYTRNDIDKWFKRIV